jgi:hypothetical protein
MMSLRSSGEISGWRPRMLVTIERVCPESKAMRTRREMMRESRLLRYLAIERSMIGSRIELYWKSACLNALSYECPAGLGQTDPFGIRDPLELLLFYRLNP